MNTNWNKKTFTNYIIWAFGISWIMQIIASIFSNQGETMVFGLIMAVAMYTPFLAVILAKIPLKGMGWKPKLRGNIRYILAAWLLPAVFVALGAVLYFIIFPSRFDLSGKYIIESLGEAAWGQMEAQGMTIPMYMATSLVQGFTFAPWVNMFMALGEEVGWRGAMQPMLNNKFGKSKGRMIGGIIWGAWHWPVMVLAGYEYGMEYFGAPVLGMVLFCIVTVVIGVFLDVSYEKTECIWIPALAHGAINCFATFPPMFQNPEYMDQMILGPAPMGIISVLPAAVVAVWLLVKKQKA